ncbi:hypothetical protein BJ170DRAFT_599228 [Xylariales sp. AK1849]|nr:hypothetical protein BJ170DRAFT_599228 [Xylariales sp. AK1849]
MSLILGIPKAQQLQNAANLWGEKIIHHCSVGERGIKFAKKFAQAARQHPNWEAGALPRLQQLVCRRIQLSEYGRRSYAHAIELVDLENLLHWKGDNPHVKLKDPDNRQLPCAHLSEEQLPAGYVFDEEGLIVPGQEDISGRSNSSGIDIRILDTETISSPAVESVQADDTSATSYSTDDGKESTDYIDANNSASSALEVTTQTSCKTTAGHAPMEIGLGQAVASLGETREITTPSGLNANHNAINAHSEGDGCTSSNDIATRKSGRLATKISIQRPETATQKPPSPPKRKSYKYQQRSAVEQDQVLLPFVDVRRLNTLVNELSTARNSNPTASRHVSVVPLKRERASSLPPNLAHAQVPKRRQITCTTGTPDASSACGHEHSARLEYDWVSNRAYLVKAISEIRREAQKESTSRGCRTAKCLLPILENCKHPNIGENDGMIELHLLYEHQAQALLNETTLDVPILTESQQLFPWNNPATPTLEFLEWFEDQDCEVFVQIPSLQVKKCSYARRSIRQVYERFASGEESNDPWNILDLRVPLPSSLPNFIRGQNCQLLAQIRQEVLSKGSSGRTVAKTDDWAQWKEIEK